MAASEMEKKQSHPDSKFYVYFSGLRAFQNVAQEPSKALVLNVTEWSPGAEAGTRNIQMIPYVYRDPTSPFSCRTKIL